MAQISSLIIILGIFFCVIHGSMAMKAIECKDGTLLGINELVESVEATVETCTNSTKSKAELFSCIFRKLDMFGDDGKPMDSKIRGFFQNLFSNKVMTEAKELTKKLTTCADTYANSFSAKDSDLQAIGKAGDAFANCFFDATKKFTAYVRNECKPMEMNLNPPK